MQKLPFFFLCFFLAFMSCQSQTQVPGQATPTITDVGAAQPDTAYTDLSVAEFKAKMGSGNVVVLDVRTPAEIVEGKIDGAKEIDFRAENFASELDQLDKDATYLIYCKGGGRSSNTCKMMAEKGFKKLYNLDGGYTAWSEQNQ